MTKRRTHSLLDDALDDGLPDDKEQLGRLIKSIDGAYRRWQKHPPALRISRLVGLIQKGDFFLPDEVEAVHHPRKGFRLEKTGGESKGEEDVIVLSHNDLAHMVASGEYPPLVDAVRRLQSGVNEWLLKPLYAGAKQSKQPRSVQRAVRPMKLLDFAGTLKLRQRDGDLVVKVPGLWRPEREGRQLIARAKLILKGYGASQKWAATKTITEEAAHKAQVDHLAAFFLKELQKGEE